MIAEEFVPFNREVSLIGARNAKGDVAIYPLTENIHTNGILSVSVAAGENDAVQTQAEAMFKAVADTLDYVGVLAIEFFDVGGNLKVNEIAPRVHNSGHWTQQARKSASLKTTCAPYVTCHLAVPTVSGRLHDQYCGRSDRAGRSPATCACPLVRQSAPPGTQNWSHQPVC